MVESKHRAKGTPDSYRMPPKYRSSERRKERCRNAARFRRSHEAELFTQIEDSLPLSRQQLQQLDKISIMRVFTNYLKLNILFKQIREKSECTAYDSDYSEALDSFVFLLDEQGTVLYVSDNINKYLGIHAVDMHGSSIYQFTHPCDHTELQEVLNTCTDSDTTNSTHDKKQHFFIRLKCGLSAAGRNVNISSSSLYKVIKCTSRLQVQKTSKLNLKVSMEKPALRCIVIQGSLIPQDPEMELNNYSFVSTHTPNMTFTYTDDRVQELLGYRPTDLMHRSLFDFFHVEDSSALEKAYKHLFGKGQTETGVYRFLAKGGGYVWMQTQASITYDKTTRRPSSVVCVNHVISEIEEPDVIMSINQVESRNLEYHRKNRSAGKPANRQTTSASLCYGGGDLCKSNLLPLQHNVPDQSLASAAAGKEVSFPLEDSSLCCFDLSPLSSPGTGSSSSGSSSTLADTSSADTLFAQAGDLTSATSTTNNPLDDDPFLFSFDNLAVGRSPIDGNMTDALKMLDEITLSSACSKRPLATSTAESRSGLHRAEYSPTPSTKELNSTGSTANPSPASTFDGGNMFGGDSLDTLYETDEVNPTIGFLSDFGLADLDSVIPEVDYDSGAIQRMTDSVFTQPEEEEFRGNTASNQDNNTTINSNTLVSPSTSYHKDKPSLNKRRAISIDSAFEEIANKRACMCEDSAVSSSGTSAESSILKNLLVTGEADSYTIRKKRHSYPQSSKEITPVMCLRPQEVTSTQVQRKQPKSQPGSKSRQSTTKSCTRNKPISPTPSETEVYAGAKSLFPSCETVNPASRTVAQQPIQLQPKVVTVLLTQPPFVSSVTPSPTITTTTGATSVQDIQPQQSPSSIRTINNFGLHPANEKLGTSPTLQIDSSNQIVYVPTLPGSSSLLASSGNPNVITIPQQTIGEDSVSIASEDDLPMIPGHTARPASQPQILPTMPQPIVIDLACDNTSQTIVTSPTTTTAASSAATTTPSAAAATVGHVSENNTKANTPPTTSGGVRPNYYVLSADVLDQLLRSAGVTIGYPNLNKN